LEQVSDDDDDGARGDIRGRHTAIQLGASPSGLISNPLPSSPYFYTGCPSCRKPPNLSWLGTGTKYARLGYPVA